MPAMIGGFRFSLAASRKDRSCVLSPISARATTAVERRKASSAAVLLLASARPNLDRAPAAALLERLHLHDLARCAGVRGNTVRLCRNCAASVSKSSYQVAVRAALAESLDLGIALCPLVDGITEGTRLAAVGDRTPQLPVPVARGKRIGHRKGEEESRRGEGSHGYLTRARMARSSPWMVVGYIRPPMISLRIPIDWR